MIGQILLVILLTLCAFHYFIRYGRKGRIIDKIPGPRPVPIIGNLLLFLGSKEQMWQVARKINTDYYPINRMWSLSSAIVNMRHPNDIQILLSSTQHIEKSSFYDPLHAWLGTGLLTSTGAKWQRRRKILTPAFHFNVLQKYFEIITEVDKKTLDSLKQENSDVYNVYQFLTKHALSVIIETAMGVQLQEQEDSSKKYRNAVREMGDTFIYRIRRPWYRYDRLYHITPQGAKQKRALHVLHDFTTEIINERKKYHEKTMGKYLSRVDSGSADEDDSTEVFGIRKRRLAMLDLLITAYRDGRQIDDAGIAEEVDTFMFEGHDTTAIALVYTLLLLAEHKDVQTRARDEVTEIFNKRNEKIRMVDIQKFNYLERCVKEALRLYPSVPVISRRINEDLQLKNYLLPKGTIANIHIYDVHRDPNFWPEPEKFDPDRFLPEKVEGRHRFCYIPFSAGPRNCIGQKFAMMEIKSLVAHLLYDFYLEPIDVAHKVPLARDLVLRPGGPVYIKLKPIHKLL